MPAARRPDPAPRGGAWPRRWPVVARRVAARRGVPRVPGVRADGHRPSSTPTSGPRAGRTSQARRAGRRGAGDDLGRRAGAGRRRRRAFPPPCCCPVPPAGYGPAPPWPRPAASPTPSPSTWAAPRPTCAWSRAACPNRRPDGWSAVFRCGSPPSTSTPSAPAAGRSPASTPAEPWWSAPESAGADPGPACYGRGGTAPTVTDADLVLGRISGRRRLPRARAPRRASRGRGPRERRRDRRGGGRGGRRRHGAGHPGRHRRTGRRSPGPRPGRLRGGGAPPRLSPWPKRSDAGRDRAAPGRGAIRRRPAVLSPSARNWSGRGPRRPTPTGSPMRWPLWRTRRRRPSAAPTTWNWRSLVDCRYRGRATS